MPSVLTGANLANRDLLYLGVSGDGDSASIGLGQFATPCAAACAWSTSSRTTASTA
jgi:pyruvate/2-oxoacid:ferredoxin oxidoreductase beta subunit